MKLSGKRIIVTGSTEGIGAAVAEGLLGDGAEVVLNSHLPDPPADFLDRMRALGPCHYVHADLSTIDGPRKVVEEGAACMNGVDCLVNNAGTCVEASFLDTTPENFSAVFDLNVRGYFLASQQFARIVGQREFDACVICTGSTNSIQAERDLVLYDASKGAVLMMVRGLAVTLAGQGIRVVGVGPGLIRTQLNDYGHQDDEGMQRLLESQIPVGRIGLPRDVAGAVAFLASDDARYITGQMLYVDGGISALQMTYELREGKS
jgi:NAD(P)-dependent dehydrogenase (short-subunit alcohol dehydrogenase family)